MFVVELFLPLQTASGKPVDGVKRSERRDELLSEQHAPFVVDAPAQYLARGAGYTDYLRFDARRRLVTALPEVAPRRGT